MAVPLCPKGGKIRQYKDTAIGARVRLNSHGSHRHAHDDRGAGLGDRRIGGHQGWGHFHVFGCGWRLGLLCAQRWAVDICAGSWHRRSARAVPGRFLRARQLHSVRNDGRPPNVCRHAASIGQVLQWRDTARYLGAECLLGGPVSGGPSSPIHPQRR
jgi:hypothetical protein